RKRQCPLRFPFFHRHRDLEILQPLHDMGGIDGPIGLNDRMNVLCHHFRWNSHRLSRLRDIHCDTGEYDGAESAKYPSRYSLDHGKPLHQISEAELASEEHTVVGIIASLTAHLR